MHAEDYAFNRLPTYKKKINSFSLNPYFPYVKNYKSILRSLYEQTLRKMALKTFNHKNIEYIYFKYCQSPSDELHWQCNQKENQLTLLIDRGYDSSNIVTYNIKYQSYIHVL